LTTNSMNVKTATRIW